LSIIIQNQTGATLTLVHESGSSIAANRIRLIGAANLVIPIDGKATLIYATGNRWELLETNFGNDTLQDVTARGATTTVPSLNIGQSTGASDVNFNLGQGRTANGNAYIDFHSAPGGADFDFRIIKNVGAGGEAEIRNVSGQILIITESESNINFATSGVSRLIIHAGSGNVSIGSTAVTDAKLFVNGNIKTNGTLSCGQFTNATEPVYVKGAQFFNTSLNKIRIGGAAQYETVTSTIEIQ
jgi:hypothetical protein